MEEEIKKHFEKLPTPFLVVNEHYEIIYINGAGKRLLKYNDNSPHLTSYVAGNNDVLKILDCFNDITKGKLENSTLEFEIENNGIRSSVNGYFLKCDSVDRTVQLVLTDITEKKTLEQEIRNKGTYLNIVLESLPVGVTIADGNGYIKHVNEKALSISGLKREEIIGQWSLDLFPSGEDSKSFFDSMLELLKGNITHIKGVYKFKRGDGSLVDVELITQMLDDKQGYVATTREI